MIIRRQSSQNMKSRCGTIDEAAAYSGISRDKLYEMTNRENCPFVLWIGHRRLIKRQVFDEYIANMYSV